MNGVDESLPGEVQCDVYASHYADLSSLSPVQLLHHYEQYGRNEGRVASEGQSRSWFVQRLSQEFDCLEIGPFDCPVLSGPRVSYFDVMDQAGLAARAAALGRTHNRTPHIDFVSPTGDLAVIDGNRFDAVLSAHAIEHQPDLVYHLQQVERILRPGGVYVAIIPDKRFCFDHFIAETTVADVIDAHHSRRRSHTVKSVIEHRALTCHNDSSRHWNGDHGPRPVAAADTVRSAVQEFENAEGGYVDVHAWQFHPEQFRELIAALNQLGVISLQPVRVYGTLRNDLEFIAVLQRPQL